MPKAKLIVGSDPEFMLVDNHGNLKSAIGIVKGTKEEKIDLGDGNKLFYDNVLAEVNINPADSPDGLVQSFANCLSRLSRAISPYQLRLQASATYPPAECKHPDALVFGCDPEFDAYQMGIVQAPECKTTFRSAGGHVHLGYSVEEWPLKAPNDEDGGVARAWGRVWVVRMLDLFLGIPSLWIDQDPHSPARRKLYGKAGYHRPSKPDNDYGVEYRATSNFWLRSPETVKLVFNICDFVVGFVAENRHLELWEDEQTCKAYNAETLQKAINESDKKLAKDFLNTFVKKYMPNELYGQILQHSEPVQVNLIQSWGL